MRRFIMTFAATAVLGGTSAVTCAQDYQARSTALGKLMDTRVDVKFSGHEFRQVVSFLSQVAGLDILAK